ncbi:DNA-directed RNA polymerase subunit K/omega [Thermonema lapsum]|uniref:DNA-directed RNA polymerase subunit omega n=1 Tax=Thermonema lapsum TaxID=28195 RepID=A0A846MPG0_9BACT|nr:DNA-directed RNA polymerase subunit omega [Thermonema lapsum]NIK73443.1 DNA-directed RNA polymerase subunit K/omega [Thermonema lapsum]
MKKIQAPISVVTRDTNQIASKTDNIYESVHIIAQRANQIAQQLKEELHEKLRDFSMPHDNLEEVFENKEQIEISKYYERLPKPTAIAIEEFLQDKLMWRLREEEKKEHEEL